jgi:hypothetical protein
LRRRSRKRLLQVGDRTGLAITAALREAVEASSTQIMSGASSRRYPHTVSLRRNPRKLGTELGTDLSAPERMWA